MTGDFAPVAERRDVSTVEVGQDPDGAYIRLHTAPAEALRAPATA